MSRIEECLKNLIEAVQQSNEYKRYHDADNKLSEYPELEEAVHEFSQEEL